MWRSSGIEVIVDFMKINWIKAYAEQLMRIDSLMLMASMLAKTWLVQWECLKLLSTKLFEPPKRGTMKLRTLDTIMIARGSLAGLVTLLRSAQNFPEFWFFKPYFRSSGRQPKHLALESPNETANTVHCRWTISTSGKCDKQRLLWRKCCSSQLRYTSCWRLITDKYWMQTVRMSSKWYCQRNISSQLNYAKYLSMNCKQFLLRMLSINESFFHQFYFSKD